MFLEIDVKEVATPWLILSGVHAGAIFGPARWGTMRTRCDESVTNKGFGTSAALKRDVSGAGAGMFVG